MGCGVSQSVIQGNDDISKSDAFVRLCTCEQNPVAVQLNAYFNAITSECLYKSQGDMNSYQRLLEKRPTEIIVNRSKLAAQRHGIGRKPLTVVGVNDIMNLFLGHVIKSLERRKWSGSFNYVLLQPKLDVNESADHNSFHATAIFRSGPTQNPALKKSGISASHKKNVATDVGASDLPADTSATLVESSRKSKRSTSSGRTAATTNSNTLVFIDRGNGTHRDDDPSWQWRMELTGSITYPSVDGALTLICDCKVAFLFFTCDNHLSPPSSNTKLQESPTFSIPNAPLRVSSTSQCSVLPVANAVEYTGLLVQSPMELETGRRQLPSCGKSNSNHGDGHAQ